MDSSGVALSDIVLSESAGDASDDDVVVAVTTLFPSAGGANTRRNMATLRGSLCLKGESERWKMYLRSNRKQTSIPLNFIEVISPDVFSTEITKSEGTHFYAAEQRRAGEDEATRGVDDVRISGLGQAKA